MIDKRPRVIARCVDVTDVMAAVEFGRGNDLLTAIRGGGHNGAGLETCDGGLVSDLSRIKGIRMDPAVKRSALRLVAFGGMWITLRTSSAWPRRAASSAPLELAV